MNIYRALLFAIFMMIGNGALGAEEVGSNIYEPVTLRPEIDKSQIKRIALLVNYDCKYSFDAFETMANWSRTLPFEYKVEIVPAIGMNNHILPAYYFYALNKYTSLNQIEISNILFSVFLNSRARSSNEVAIKEISRLSGISISALADGINDSVIKAHAFRAAAFTEDLNISEVPVAVVAGRHMTMPKRVQNDGTKFITILNGLVSMDIDP